MYSERTCAFLRVLGDFATQLDHRLFVGRVVVTGEHDGVVALSPSTRRAVTRTRGILLQREHTSRGESDFVV